MAANDPPLGHSPLAHRRPQFRLGLTGGIGSGKSTVARCLQDLGAHLIDADAIARSLTAAGGAATAAIAQSFGPTSIAADGGMDRVRMRQLVFQDPEARERLQAIVHPLVQAQVLRQYQAIQETTKAWCVLEIPLLVESAHWRSWLHKVLVVDCSESTQVARVMARDGLDAATARRIMAAQASRIQRLACADAVICNESLSLAELQQSVAQFVKFLA